MSGEKDLGKELLRQNGIEPGSLPEDRRKELRAMIERDKKRVTRMKWATVVALSVVLLLFIVGGLVGRIFPREAVMMSVGFPLAIMFYVVVAFTISWYLRSRSLGQRQIQASLADIAEQLKQLVENQQAKASE